MAEDKKSFVAYADWQSQFNLLSDDEAGRLIKHIFSYVKSTGSILLTENRIINMAFQPIKFDLDIELSKKTFGSKHWNWKGGKTNKNIAIRNSSLVQDWRKQVFERDNYTCQHCSTKGGYLNAHHILEFSKYPALRANLDNGITLCKSCHIEEHKKMKQEEKKARLNNE